MLVSFWMHVRCAPTLQPAETGIDMIMMTCLRPLSHGMGGVLDLVQVPGVTNAEHHCSPPAEAACPPGVPNRHRLVASAAPFWWTPVETAIPVVLVLCRVLGVICHQKGSHHGNALYAGALTCCQLCCATLCRLTCEEAKPVSIGRLLQKKKKKKKSFTWFSQPTSLIACATL